MKRNHWLYLLVLLCVTALVAWHYSDRDARRINKRLNQLADTLGKESGEGQLRTLAKSQQVVDFFTPEAELRLQPVLRQRTSRRELSTIFHQVHSRLDTLDVRIRDRRLDVDESGETAEMRFTAVGTAGLAGDRETQMHEFHLQWVKQDREWYIDRAEIVQAIRPPRQ